MNYYPINLDIRRSRCLVVGGGKVAVRKVKTLLEAKALVTVISLEIDDELKNMQEQGSITCEIRACVEQDLDNCFLAVIATNNKEVNQKLAEYALSKQKLVNTVDSKDLSNFIVPATYNNGDLSISISTGGASPIVAASIKKELSKLYGEEYAILLERLKEEREIIKEKYASQKERKEVLGKRVKELMANVFSDDRLKS